MKNNPACRQVESRAGLFLRAAGDSDYHLLQDRMRAAATVIHCLAIAPGIVVIKHDVLPFVSHYITYAGPILCVLGEHESARLEG